VTRKNLKCCPVPCRVRPWRVPEIKDFRSIVPRVFLRLRTHKRCPGLAHAAGQNTAYVFRPIAGWLTHLVMKPNQNFNNDHQFHTERTLPPSLPAGPDKLQAKEGYYLYIHTNDKNKTDTNGHRSARTLSALPFPCRTICSFSQKGKIAAEKCTAAVPTPD
jgi:hypothetical protein